MLLYEAMLRAAAAEGQYKVVNFIKDAQVFVTDSNVVPDVNENINNKLLATDDSKDDELDLPFKVCSFEVLSERGIRVRFHVGGVAAFVIHNVVAVEMSPKEWVFLTLMHPVDDERNIQIRWYHKDGTHNDIMWRILKRVVENHLAVLKNGQYGYQSPRTLVKWKENGEKKQTRINKVIYVRPRSKSGSLVHEGREVQWSHAFWVMGHWRDISGIGKDRDGNYNVKGKTWVVPHVKNAELGDPVNKIRVAKNIDEQNAIN